MTKHSSAKLWVSFLPLINFAVLKECRPMKENRCKVSQIVAQFVPNLTGHLLPLRWENVSTAGSGSWRLISWRHGPRWHQLWECAGERGEILDSWNPPLVYRRLAGPRGLPKFFGVVEVTVSHCNIAVTLVRSENDHKHWSSSQKVSPYPPVIRSCTHNPWFSFPKESTIGYI